MVISLTNFYSIRKPCNRIHFRRLLKKLQINI